MAIVARKFWLTCVTCLIVAGAHLASGQDAVEELSETPFPNSKSAKLDENGDPLPPQSRFRFGSERFVSSRPVIDMALSPDGTTVLTRDSEQILCWDAATGRIRWRADIDSQWNASYGSRAFAFSDSSEFFYSQCGPEKLQKWKIATGQLTSVAVKNPLPLLPENRPVNSFPGAVQAIDVSPDGSRIAAAGGHGVVVYDEFGNSLFQVPNKPNLALAPADWKGDPLLFSGHYSLAVFAPDGKTLAVLTSDSPNDIRLLDETGQETCKIALNSRLVRMAIAPDGRSIATSERNRAVSQYSTVTGRLDWQFLPQPDQSLPEDFSSAVAFSPDGKLVAAAVPQFGEEVICIFTSSDGALQSSLKGHRSKPWGVTFSADSRTLFSAGLDRIIRRWDVPNATPIPLEKGFHCSGVVAASLTGDRMAFSDSLGNIHLYRTTKTGRSAKEERIVHAPSVGVSAMALSRDGELLACGSTAAGELTVVVWNTSTANLVHRWELSSKREPNSKIGALEFSLDATRLAVCVNGGGRAALLDVVEGKQIAELEHESICGVSFDHSGNQLVTAGANEKMCFWETATGKLLKTKELIGGDLQNVLCSPVEDLIVTAHFPNVLRIWNSKDMTLLKRAPLSGEANFEALAFSSDGNWLATGSSGQVYIFNARTGERIWRAGSHSGRVAMVGFTDQNKALVSGGNDGKVYCWELMPDQESGSADFDKLWLGLRDSDETEVKQLLWKLVQIGDPAIEEVEQRLNSITRIVNLRAITKGVDQETAASRVRLAIQFCEKTPTAETDVRLKRAIEFLAMIRNPKSVAILKRLKESHPSKDVQKEAMFALETIR